MISEKNQKIIFIFFIAVTLALYVLFNEKRLHKSEKDRVNNAEYTIGVLKKWSIPYKQSAIAIDYKYFAHEQLYEAYDYLPNTIDLKDVNTEGGKYIVRFSRKDLENAEILFELGEVPDSIADEALEYKLYWDSIPKW